MNGSTKEACKTIASTAFVPVGRDLPLFNEAVWARYGSEDIFLALA